MWCDLYLLHLLMGLNAVEPGQHWALVISGTSSIELPCEEQTVFNIKLWVNIYSSYPEEFALSGEL